MSESRESNLPQDKQDLVDELVNDATDSGTQDGSVQTDIKGGVAPARFCY